MKTMESKHQQRDCDFISQIKSNVDLYSALSKNL